MKVHRCYVEKSNLAVGDVLKIEAPVCHHLVNVLKIKPDQALMLFNGSNRSFFSKITQITRHSVSVLVQKMYEEDRESHLKIHLLQGISKGDRMDFTLQKSVELGVSEITPVFSERSEVRLKGERIESKMAHWRKVIISACEQSGRNRLPVLHPPVPFMEWIRAYPVSLGLIADPRATQTLHGLSVPGEVALMVGPEGGFSLTEIDWAIQHHFVPIRLGPRILRTETAAMVMITALQYQAGDL